MSSLKNIEKSTVLTLKEQVAYQPGQVVSKTLAQNEALSVTLFAFDKSEEISTHESGGDAFVTCLDGTGRITIDGVDYELHEGESIVMPARHPHAVFGQEQFKMLLVVSILISNSKTAAIPAAVLLLLNIFANISDFFVERRIITANPDRLRKIQCIHSNKTLRVNRNRTVT